MVLGAEPLEPLPAVEDEALVVEEEQDGCRGVGGVVADAQDLRGVKFGRGDWWGGKKHGKRGRQIGSRN